MGAVQINDYRRKLLELTGIDSIDKLLELVKTLNVDPQKDLSINLEKDPDITSKVVFVLTHLYCLDGEESWPLNIIGQKLGLKYNAKISVPTVFNYKEIGIKALKRINQTPYRKESGLNLSLVKNNNDDKKDIGSSSKKLIQLLESEEIKKEKLRKLLFNFGVNDENIISELSSYISIADFSLFLLLYDEPFYNFQQLLENYDLKINSVKKVVNRILSLIEVIAKIKINEGSKELIAMNELEYHNFFEKIRVNFLKFGIVNEKQIQQLINTVSVADLELFIEYSNDDVSYVNLAKEKGIMDHVVARAISNTKNAIKAITGTEVQIVKNFDELNSLREELKDLLRTFGITNEAKLDYISRKFSPTYFKMFKYIYLSDGNNLSRLKEYAAKENLKEEYVREKLAYRLNMITEETGLDLIGSITSKRAVFVRNVNRQDLKLEEYKKLKPVPDLLIEEDFGLIVYIVNKKLTERCRNYVLMRFPLDGSKGMKIKDCCDELNLAVGSYKIVERQATKKICLNLSEDGFNEEEKQQLKNIVSLIDNDLYRTILILLFSLSEDKSCNSKQKISCRLNINIEIINEAISEFKRVKEKKFPQLSEEFEISRKPSK